MTKPSDDEYRTIAQSAFDGLVKLLLTRNPPRRFDSPFADQVAQRASSNEEQARFNTKLKAEKSELVEQYASTPAMWRLIFAMVLGPLLIAVVVAGWRGARIIFSSLFGI